MGPILGLTSVKRGGPRYRTHYLNKTNAAFKMQLKNVFRLAFPLSVLRFYVVVIIPAYRTTIIPLAINK